MRILVFNCGSSSLKFELIELEGESYQRLARGTFEEIGRNTQITLSANGEKSEESAPVADHEAASGRALDWLKRRWGTDFNGVAHRIVHGGETVTEPAIANSEVMRALDQASEFAPLHNPPALSALRAVGTRLPGLPVVVVTDTGFHRTLPPYARHYAIPHALAERHGIRRFGFHGIGHAWMLERCASMMQTRPEELNLITMHLGAGCSAAAIKQGRSIDTSMGLTPLEGLMMATRSGDIDPAIFSFLAIREKASPAQVERILNHESGLLGVSGVSADLREIQRAAASDQCAALAIEMFCYRLRKYIGAYLAVLGQVNGIVFGGGIGEHSETVRERVCSGLESLGIVLDPQRNRAANGREGRLSANNSPIGIYLVALDEELYIARAAARLLSTDRQQSSRS